MTDQTTASTEGNKLERLHEGLKAEQRALVLHEADAGVLPAAGTLSRIADLEGAIVATETLMDEIGDVG